MVRILITVGIMPRFSTIRICCHRHRRRPRPSRAPRRRSRRRRRHLHSHRRHHHHHHHHQAGILVVVIIAIIVVAVMLVADVLALVFTVATVMIIMRRMIMRRRKRIIVILVSITLVALIMSTFATLGSTHVPSNTGPLQATARFGGRSFEARSPAPRPSHHLARKTTNNLEYNSTCNEIDKLKMEGSWQVFAHSSSQADFPRCMLGRRRISMVGRVRLASRSFGLCHIYHRRKVA